MRSKTITLSGVGSSAWIPLDSKQTPFNVGLYVKRSGTIVYDVEHTLDNILDTSVTPNVLKHPDLQGQTSSNEGYYAFPIRAVRITNKSGVGTTEFTVIQGLR